MWVNTGKTTPLSRETVQQYQDKLPRKEPRRVPATDRPTADKISQMSYGMAVLIPPADTCTVVLERALQKDAPFAILMPISLLTKANLTADERAKVKRAAKHILLEPELVWIMHNVPGVENCQVHRRELPYFGPKPDMIGIMVGPPKFDTTTWPQKQQKLVKANAKIYKGKL